MTIEHLKVKGGTYGADFIYTPGNVQYNGADYGTTTVIEVLTDTPLTFADAGGRGHGNPGAVGIQVNPGVHADITLAGVHISHRMPLNIMTNKAQNRDNPTDPTRCHITLADGTENVLGAYDGGGYSGAGIRCGESSVLVIDDSVRNTTAPGGNVHDQSAEVVPVNGAIGADKVLANGTRLTAGDPISKLDAAHPGTLLVWGGCNAAGIGGTNRESAGRITINGGDIQVNAYHHSEHWTWSESMNYQAAGIGGGNCGGITGLTFNAGKTYAEGQIHGAAIGSGTYYLPTRNQSYLWPDAFLSPDTDDRATFEAGVHGGDITINGGFIKAMAPNHGNAFGDGCGSSNNGHVLRVTGGTLLPDSSISESHIVDLGFKGGHVIITGGSVNCTKTGTDAAGNDTYKFDGIGGTAWGNEQCLVAGYDPSDPDDPNKVFKITINLSAEIEKRNNEAGITGGALNDTIKNWALTVGGTPYPYGSPSTFDHGKLYLWLPKSDLEKEVVVDLSYIDEKGTEQKIEPLFRTPGTDHGGDVLKRYIDFELPPSYLTRLEKPYDGLPFDTFKLSAQNPPLTGLITDAAGNRVSDGKNLTDESKVTYKYQPHDRRGGSPTGPEVSTDAGGNPLREMPSDVGVMKFTVTSTQYAEDTEGGFCDSYWGHRATGWCEIKPVPSAVASVRATWADGSEVADPQDPAKELTVEVDVTSGTFPDGTPTATTCKAPTGRVQLYVDGKPAGRPLDLQFGEGGNARVETGAGGREHTVASWTFPVGELMTAGARHRITARYLPAKNYLESADPQDADVPESEVAVGPDRSVAPEPLLAKSVRNLTHPEGPTQPGDRLKYAITASNGAAGSLWTQAVVTDRLPAALELDEHSVRLTNAWEGLNGQVLAKSASTAPSDVGKFSLPTEDGRQTLTVPVGSVSSVSPGTVEFECTVRRGLDLTDPAQSVLANVAEGTGMRPNPDSEDGPDVGPVNPDPSQPTVPPGPSAVAPADPAKEDVRMAKAVANLTHPDGKETQVGDRLRYTVTLENVGPADSALYDAVISDPLPTGIEPVPGTLRLTGNATDSIAVPDAAYDRATRTIAVAVGDLRGGQRWELTFECEVRPEAVGADNGNVAYGFGTPPSHDGERDPSKPGANPGDEAEPPAPGRDPAVESDPALPPELVPDDPEAGDVSIAKTARNATRDDGTTHVGDTIHYEITLRNEAVGTGWIDVVMRDDVPVGVEPVSQTIRLVLAGGTIIDVDDTAYDPDDRILAVAAGRLYGGQEVRLSFDALVTADAVGADIGNVATGYGTLPSGRDPNAPELVPGEPFKPAEGWDAYEKDRAVQRVRTEPVYPEGITSEGGVVDGNAPDESSTIRRRLAQTGDALAAAALLPVAAALAAGALALAARRRRLT